MRCYRNKLGVVPIIAVLLLLIIVSIISLATFYYFQGFTQDTQDLITTDSSLIPLQVQVLSYDRNSAFIQFPTNFDNISISRVTFDGVECEFAPLGQIESRFITINLTNCNEHFSILEPLLRIETNKYLIEQKLRIIDEFTIQLNATEIEEEIPTGFEFQSSSSFNCNDLPGSWIEVPGSSYFGTDDFCVMQFEAKAYNLAEEEVEARSSNSISGFIPYSSPDATPWANINFTNSRMACNSLNTNPLFDEFGGNFTMITNRQWMTIARDAEQQSVNWANNVTGSTVSEGGGLFRGNVNLNDAISCNHGSALDGNTPGTNCIVSGGDGRNKRTLILSNEAVIWDLAGNVWQWVDLMEDGSPMTNVNACPGPNEFTTCSSSDLWNDGFSKNNSLALGLPLEREMGPLGDFDSTNGVGRIFSSTSTGGRVLRRGGAWGNDDGAGAFAALLINGPGITSAVIGFRCAFEP